MHFEIYVIHTPTNGLFITNLNGGITINTMTLFINLVKSFKFTLK